jgi:leucyl-tRNA---protein transferase
MEIDTHCVRADEEGFKGHILDTMLKLGYYRTQHLMFTCVQAQADENSHAMPVFWLRSKIATIKEQKQATTIRKKCAAFTVTVLPAILSEEVENLYTLYRNHVPFSTSETCTSYLHQPTLENPFESYMIQVRDGATLIAVGFFDKGSTAIAGIMNMYHPKYQAYSLGKYLMLQKIDFARANGIAWYYTGYISTSITRFDYKIFPDVTSVEVYLPIERKWLPYQFMDKENLHDYYINNLV